ncbi:MAG: ABC transporter permease [Gemmatimonadota bacterium]|nr:MAG: ABC transporter permease [Gemmatimonadota bacterium]
MRALSPHRLRQLLKKELRQMLRDPRMKAVIFVAPVIQLMIFGYAVNTDIRDTATYVVDQDKTAASRELVQVFAATGYFDIVGRSDRPADLAHALDNGHAVVGIEIPTGFASDVARGTSTVQVLVDGTDSNTGTVAQAYAGQIVLRYARDYMHRTGRLPSGGIDLRTRAWYNPELESRVYNVPAVVGVLVMLMGLLLTSLAVVRERELGTLDQLMVSPLSATELILGKTIPVMLVGLIQITLISCVAILWFKIPMRGSVLVLLPAALLYILAGISLGLIISTISKTQQEAFMAMFLVLFPIIILSGFMFPVDSMADFFRGLSLLDPIRHFVEIVRALFLKGEGFVGLWRQYVALALIAVSLLMLAMLRLRMSTD